MAADRFLRRGSGRCAITSVVVMLVVGLSSGRASADEGATRMAARALGTEGIEAYQTGDFDTASDRLEAAYAVLKVPTLALWSARALAKRGQLIEAAERYLEATRLRPETGGSIEIQKEAQEEAMDEREDLLERIPSLVVRVEKPADSAVKCLLNGEPINPALLGRPQAVNPGAVQVHCSGPGGEQHREITLTEAKSETVSLRFQDARLTNQGKGSAVRDEPPGKGKALRTAGWITLGVGVAGLAAGGALGAIALGKKANFDCTGTQCNEAQDDLDQFNSLLVPSSVAFIAGGVLTATGLSLVLFAPKDGKAAAVSPYVGLSSFGMRGKF